MPAFCKVELRCRRILDPLGGSTLSVPDTLLLRKNCLLSNVHKRKERKTKRAYILVFPSIYP
jgi:hypothetical protein